MIYRLIIFLVINFAGLAIGGSFTRKGVSSEWYMGLTKAPWTPPGWVFGSAWTIIMICFTVFMAYVWPEVKYRNLLIALFVLQWVLNVGWNPVFFYYHRLLAGLLIITSLTALIGFFLIYFWPELKLKSLLVLPYLAWLIIATSLNAYILIKN